MNLKVCRYSYRRPVILKVSSLDPSRVAWHDSQFKIIPFPFKLVFFTDRQVGYTSVPEMNILGISSVSGIIKNQE